MLLCSACTAPSEESSPRIETQNVPSPTSDKATPSEGTGQSSEASFDAASIHVLVNKHHQWKPEESEPADLTELEVPQQFGGQQLRQEAATALEELIAAAAEEDISLWVTTGYRDVGHQQALYDQRVAEVGQDAADRLIARPSYSEHHTGLAVDMSFEGNQDCNLHVCFADTRQGQWLADNAQQYGFIIRYPEDAKQITGYSYEPWHLRYVGVSTAQDVTSRGVTLEEYWNQPPAPDYREGNE